MGFSTIESVTATASRSVGTITLTATAEETVPLRLSMVSNGSSSDELMDALENMPAVNRELPHAPETDSHLLSTESSQGGPALAEGDGREALPPSVPISRPEMRSPRVSRIPVRHTRRPRSLPVNELRPLSDGPWAHEPIPLSARPSHFESLGPIERFPPPRDRLSLIGYVGTICEGEQGYNARLARESFTYNPRSESVITHIKKEKWYVKGAFKLKKAFVDRKEK